MQNADFSQVADILLRRTGRLLTPDKAFLAASRLAPLARDKGARDAAGLLNALPAGDLAADEIAAALIPKETWFFRERPALEQVVTGLASRLKAAPSGRVRIWCAGGGTGQEAFSLAMLVEAGTGTLPGGGEGVEIVSTDLSLAATRRARAGEFDHFEIQKGLCASDLLTHFRPLANGAWQASPALRGWVLFHRHNLLDGVGDLGQFDLVLCRHVLSGMTRRASLQAIDTLASAMAPGAQLILGDGETLTGLTEKFEPSRALRGAWAVAGVKQKSGASVA